jgi:hypothetical protein
MASRGSGGLVGSWLAMGGRGWSLEVAADLGGSQVTIVTCQNFINAPNFKIKKLELPSLFEVGRE